MWEKIRKVKVPPLAKLLVEALNYIWGVKSHSLYYHITAFKVTVNIMCDESGLESAFFAYSLILSRNIQILRKNEFDTSYRYIAAGVTAMRRYGHCLHAALEEMIVAKDGSGDFTSISDAVSAASSGDKNFVKSGIYNERVEILVPDIEIEGESPENTVLVSAVYARMKGDDGEKLGTFRTYTMLVNSDRFTCRNMTIANSSGFGSAVGQAVAVYAEGDGILFEN